MYTNLPEKITAVYRPLQDVDWAGEVYNYTTDKFGAAVTINSPVNYVMDIITPQELRAVSIPPSRSAEYISRLLRAELSAGFKSDLPVKVTGAGYFKSSSQSRVPLLIKLGSSPGLLDENDAIFNVLAPYGLKPRNNLSVWFNIIIGSVALKRLDGEQKQQLQHGLKDRIPSDLTLSPGVIQWAHLRSAIKN